MVESSFVRIKGGLRAAALMGVVALGVLGIVGSGGGVAFLPSDCPPGWDCNALAPPVPVVRPARVTAQVGTPVTFTMTGLNVPAATYQWSRSSDGGGHYVAIAGATGDTLLLASVNLADDGAIFKLTATANGLSGSAVSHLAVAASPGAALCRRRIPGRRLDVDCDSDWHRGGADPRRSVRGDGGSPRGIPDDDRPACATGNYWRHRLYLEGAYL